MTSLAAARALVFDERFRFDTFVAGATTTEAVEGARLVAEAPGARWNPLIVCGATGLGKSHLLGAVARRARELRPALRVVACTALEPESARLARDAADLLVIDDLRAGVDPAVAAELREAVDAAVAAGRQVVLAEDGALVSREEAGAWLARYPRARLVRVAAPDAEARLEIARNAATARGLALAPDALRTIAAEPVQNVRELLGRLTRVSAAPAAPDAALGADTDFASFLDEVAREVAAHVEPWRLRLGEAAARWRAEGIVVDVLERALRLAAAPDVDALLATFETVVSRLRALEAEAVAHDPSVAGDAAFRDPARMADAEALAAASVRPAPAAVAAPAPTPPAVPAVAPRAALDAETWVVEWPDVRDLLIEAWG